MRRGAFFLGRELKARKLEADSHLWHYDPLMDPIAPRPKLFGSLRLKLTVGAVSALVLAAGVMLAPEPAPAAMPVSQERTAPLLEEEVQRREPIRVFRGLQDLARRVAQHGVAIPGGARPEILADVPRRPAGNALPGFGIVTETGQTVLTHVSALDGRREFPVHAADGTAHAAQVIAHEASTGLTLLTIPGAALMPAILSLARPAPGSLAAASGPWAGGHVVAPVFVTSAGDGVYAVGALDAAVPAGIPIYDLDGGAFAIASGSAGVAFAIAESVGRLRARVSAGRAFDSSIGVGLGLRPASPPTAPPATGGGVGVLVARVEPDEPAGEAGLAVGDLLTDVGDTQVDSPEAARAAIWSLTPGTPATLRVRRNSRSRTVTVVPQAAFDRFFDAGDLPR